MNKNLKIVVALTLIVLVLVGAYFYFFGRPSNFQIGIPNRNTIVGDVASYVNYLTCDEYSKLAIEKFDLPKDKIHSCDSNLTEVENEKFYLVEIEYGEGMDCPAGCIFELGMYKVSEDKLGIEEYSEGISDFDMGLTEEDLMIEEISSEEEMLIEE